MCCHVTGSDQWVRSEPEHEHSRVNVSGLIQGPIYEMRVVALGHHGNGNDVRSETKEVDITPHGKCLAIICCGHRTQPYVQGKRGQHVLVLVGKNWFCLKKIQLHNTWNWIPNSEYQTVLNFTAAIDDGRSGCDWQVALLLRHANFQSDHHHRYTNTRFYRPRQNTVYSCSACIWSTNFLCLHFVCWPPEGVNDL